MGYSGYNQNSWDIIDIINNMVIWLSLKCKTPIYIYTYVFKRGIKFLPFGGKPCSCEERRFLWRTARFLYISDLVSFHMFWNLLICKSRSIHMPSSPTSTHRSPGIFGSALFMERLEWFGQTFSQMSLTGMAALWSVNYTTGIASRSMM